MATFKANEADNYGTTGGGSFFNIQNDKETKQVRFMYNTIEDVEGMSVHKIELGNKNRYVNCLRAYDEPKENCPFCRENVKLQARVFVPVYNIEEDEAQIWDRGKPMMAKLSSLCSHYANGKHLLVNTIFEVERNGKPKDMKTTYEIYNIETDDTTLEDLPEMPKILGGLVLDKTAEEMEYFLKEDEFPSSGGDDSEPPRRRGSSANDSSRSSAVRRRTPAGRNEDQF